MDISYRQLQIELKSLREQGLVAQDLKLNDPHQVLINAYQEYLIRQERKQALNNPLLLVWLLTVLLGIGIGLIMLGVELVLTTARLILSVSNRIGKQENLLKEIVNLARFYHAGESPVSLSFKLDTV